MQAIYSRYHTVNIDIYHNLDDAFHSLHAMEDNGEAFALGVYDEATETFYYSDQNVVGKSDEQLLQEKLYSLKKFDITPKEIKKYNTPTP